MYHEYPILNTCIKIYFVPELLNRDNINIKGENFVMRKNSLDVKIDPMRTAMLVIDMQKCFVEPGAVFCIAGAKKTIPPLASAIKHMRKIGVRIVWVTRLYKKDMSDMEFHRRKYLETIGVDGVMFAGSVGKNSIEDAEGLIRKDDDLSIIKPRFSAFFKTNLDSILKDSGIDTLILTGTTTPNCIRSTAYDGISYNYRVIIMEDCTSSASAEIQAANIKDMKRVGVETVQGLDEFVVITGN